MINRLLLCALSLAIATISVHAVATSPKNAAGAPQEKTVPKVEHKVAPAVFPLAHYSTPIVRATPPVTEEEKAAAKGRPCPAPEYPAGARMRNEQGTAHIEFLVAWDGWVKDARITKSSGHAELDEAALSTIGGCWFEPPRSGASDWYETSYTWEQ